jgi:hypothetical protein
MKDGDIIRNDIDRAHLLEKLEDFYGTGNLEHISVFLKRDIKDLKRFNRMIEFVGFDVDEFFFCCAHYFLEIFNKATLKHVKRVLSERRDDL